MKAKIQNIGLAAYAKLRGHRLIEVLEHGFVFDMPDDYCQQAMDVEYANSESCRHDTEVCNLRDIQRTVRSCR